MTPRNKHLGKQLRQALRASQWDASTLARRAFVSRANMARVLVGDTALSLHIYELVVEQLEVSIELMPWAAADQPPAPGRSTETVVDRAQRHLTNLTDLAGMFKPAPGRGYVSIDDMRL